MASPTDDEIAMARARGAARLKTLPRARAAHYDPALGIIVIALTNACSFTFPVEIVPDLQRASTSELLDLEIIGSGEGLRWPQIDVDLSVPNLLAGHFGVRGHQAPIAGSSRTRSKADAARGNGLKGGRPRRMPA